MDNFSLKDKYKSILTDVTSEVNRVLYTWHLNEKNAGDEDYNSLFRSYLSRIFSKKLGYREYSSIIRVAHPKPIIKYNKLVGIRVFTFNGLFYETINDFDFGNVITKFENNNDIPINFFNIEQIRFK